MTRRAYASGGTRSATRSTRPRRSSATAARYRSPTRAPGGVRAMSDYETIEFEAADGVAWVTLNRPHVHNAFNGKMAEELRDVWRGLRHDPDVNCVVLTAAGERAFCTGIDRSEVNVDWPDELAS